MEIGDIKLIKFNNSIKGKVYARGSAVNADGQPDIRYFHFGAFTNYVASVFTTDAIGLLRLIGITTESDYDIKLQGDIIVAKQSVGMGALRPEAIVNLNIA
jgi:hypothetical protein